MLRVIYCFLLYFFTYYVIYAALILEKSLFGQRRMYKSLSLSEVVFWTLAESTLYEYSLVSCCDHVKFINVIV